MKKDELLEKISAPFNFVKARAKPTKIEAQLLAEGKIKAVTYYEPVGKPTWRQDELDKYINNRIAKPVIPLNIPITAHSPKSTLQFIDDLKLKGVPIPNKIDQVKAAIPLNVPLIVDPKIAVNPLQLQEAPPAVKKASKLSNKLIPFVVFIVLLMTVYGVTWFMEHGFSPTTGN